ncbi:DMT family transporter [Streptomyces sp. L-9-10]|uniref:DMT family transporter n=1 Tax=Streptomyces sp. L-9-10 TaxID=1478131 RepID=UPI00101D7417|nr:DMT family transporter [Streptomyces sp. L-9-10]
MSALALSVLLSLVSAVAYAAGAILQERVAADTPDRLYAPLHHGVWWAAVALNGLGAVLHVVALAYGPLSLVQPLGALTIVFALPMAALFVGRGAGHTAWRGAIMASVGLAGLLALTDGADSQSLDGGERLVLAAATFGAVGLLFLVAQSVGRPVVRSMLLAGAAGAAFGIGSVFTKTVAVDWTSEAPTVQAPSLVVIAVLAGCGLLLSQAAYRGAGLAAPLAAVTVVNPVVAAAVGLTLFGEQFRYGVLGTVLALGSGVVAAGGLILLTTERLAVQTREARRHGEARQHAGRPGEGASAARPTSWDRPPDGSDAPSDPYAERPQVGEGVDVGSVPRPRTHLEVEMRSRAVTGGS